MVVEEGVWWCSSGRTDNGRRSNASGLSETKSRGNQTDFERRVSLWFLSSSTGPKAAGLNLGFSEPTAAGKAWGAVLVQDLEAHAGWYAIGRARRQCRGGLQVGRLARKPFPSSGVVQIHQQGESVLAWGCTTVWRRPPDCAPLDGAWGDRFGGSKIRVAFSGLKRWERRRRVEWVKRRGNKQRKFKMWEGFDDGVDCFLVRSLK